MILLLLVNLVTLFRVAVDSDIDANEFIFIVP